MLRGLFICALLIGLANVARADPLRVAMFNTELDRRGPGLLLRDVLKNAEDAQAVAAILAHVDPDVVLLTRFDYDLGLVALSSFNDLLGDGAYPHLFALRPNTGMATGLDINRNGRLGEPEDAQSFGRFSGNNGMAILSRYPINTDAVRDFSALLWRDLPGARLPMDAGAPFWDAAVLDVLRLSTVGHWDVPVQVGDRTLHLWAFHGSPPVFDGPEDRNGLRAAEEVRFWQIYLDGGLSMAPRGPFVVLGTSNIDPHKGDGRRADMAALLTDPRITDPRPESPGAVAASSPTDTVDWSRDGEPGNLRVDYVLPSVALDVAGAGVFWPAKGDPWAGVLGEDGRAAGRHRLVWVDVTFPPDPPEAQPIAQASPGSLP